ncbi:MAG TPA: ABC transporter substrate-binding protein [Kofleriaceae bacterium]
MKRWIVSVMALALCAVPASQVLANPPGPGSAVVKQANEKISALLKDKAAPGSKEEKDLAAKVTTSVRDLLDIDELGKRAMVDQWTKLTAEQQNEFLATLRALIEDNYVRGLRANLEYTVDYSGEAPDPEADLVVTTTINTKRHGHPYKIEVDYVLKKEGDKWKAWDVKTDGVGLVENYRQQFDKIIEHDGFAGLIARMKKKQAAQGS